MSHELRTPLNAILGFGQLLAQQAETLPGPKRTEFSRHIVRAGHHLLTLIDEILDLARIESSSMTLSLEPVDPGELFAECQTMLAGAAERRSIRLMLPTGRGRPVKADRTRLKQVLLNLLSNAIKYNREGGTVFAECQEGAPGRIRISVQDTGLGLAPEHRAALFQPFNRLGQEGSAVEGTGIGLVVTKRLVELMGGSIQVDSTAGVGSVFSLELDSAAESSAALAVRSATDLAPLKRPVAGGHRCRAGGGRRRHRQRPATRRGLRAQRAPPSAPVAPRPPAGAGGVAIAPEARNLRHARRDRRTDCRPRRDDRCADPARAADRRRCAPCQRDP